MATARVFLDGKSTNIKVKPSTTLAELHKNVQGKFSKVKGLEDIALSYQDNAGATHFIKDNADLSDAVELVLKKVLKKLDITVHRAPTPTATSGNPFGGPTLRDGPYDADPSTLSSRREGRPRTQAIYADEEDDTGRRDPLRDPLNDSRGSRGSDGLRDDDDGGKRASWDAHDAPPDGLDDYDLDDLYVEMKASLDQRDRRVFLTTHKNAFVGAEAVAWLRRERPEVVATDDEAVDLGQRMLEKGMFYHSSERGKPFVNHATQFYVFDPTYAVTPRGKLQPYIKTPPPAEEKPAKEPDKLSQHATGWGLGKTDTLSIDQVVKAERIGTQTEIAEAEYDHTEVCKVVIIGNSAVGKTSLLQRYVNKDFRPFRSTVSTEFFKREIVIRNVLVTLQLWDTAGMERFDAISALYYRNSECCVLVFDVTDPKTFASLEGWREQFLNVAPKETPLVLVGNKVDLPDRRVDGQAAARWAAENCVGYFESSAKTDVRVDDLFRRVAEICLERREEGLAQGGVLDTGPVAPPRLADYMVDLDDSRFSAATKNCPC